MLPLNTSCHIPKRIATWLITLVQNVINSVWTWLCYGVCQTEVLEELLQLIHVTQTCLRVRFVSGTWEWWSLKRCFFLECMTLGLCWIECKQQKRNITRWRTERLETAQRHHTISYSLAQLDEIVRTWDQLARIEFWAYMYVLAARSIQKIT